jgi:SAM-dependent methyltransferase
VRRLFDAKAATWPGKYAPGGPLAARLTGLAAAVLHQVPPDARVLDLGCGTGELAHHLVDAGYRAVGCDISSLMLRGAATGPGGGAPCGAAARPAGGGTAMPPRGPGRAHPAPAWVQLETGWDRLPFAAATFGVVVAASLLEYTGDPGAVLGECARVLRPGGVVLCTVPDIRHPVRWGEGLIRWAAGLAAALAAAAGRRRGRAERPNPAGPYPASRRVLADRWPAWAGYHTYLVTSRHRHGGGWWLATAARVGLEPVVGTPGGYAPLRLLTFRRPAGPRPPGITGTSAGPAPPAAAHGWPGVPSRGGSGPC